MRSAGRGCGVEGEAYEPYVGRAEKQGSQKHEFIARIKIK